MSHVLTPRNYALWPSIVECLQVLPGVRQFGERLLVPDNAWSVVHDLLGAANLSEGLAQNVYIRRDPTRAATYAHYRAIELSDEVRWKVPGEVINAFRYGEVYEDIPLTPYQRTQPREWMKENPLFHWAPGSGKTLGALLWALQDAKGSILIVCPARVRLQWRAEIRAFTKIEPMLILGEVAGEIDFRWRQEDKIKFREATPLPGVLPRISIVAWEVLDTHARTLAQRGVTTLILDEPHRAKSNQRFKMLEIPESEVPDRKENGQKPKRLDDGRWVVFTDRDNIAFNCALLCQKVTRRCGLTATPIKNLLKDIWAQLDYLQPYEWGNFHKFTERYCGGAYVGYQNAWVANRITYAPEMRKRLDSARSRVPISVSHAALPPMRRECVLVPPEAQVRSSVTVAEMKAARERGEDATIEVLLFDACSRKSQAVLAEVEAAMSKQDQTKVVVFTGRRADRRKITSMVENRLKDIKVFGGDGDDSDDFRYRIREEYMAHPGPCVFVGTRDAFGESVNLHDTDIAIMAMLPWTPGDLIQNEYRFRRLGMKRNVLVKYILAQGTYDEKVASILINKMPAPMEITDQEELEGMGYMLRGTTPEKAREDLIASILSGGLRQ